MAFHARNPCNILWNPRMLRAMTPGVKQKAQRLHKGRRYEWTAAAETPGCGASASDTSKPVKIYAPRSLQVEAIEVHHLGPGRDEVADELLLRVRTAINFGQRTELGVRAEEEIDTGAGPLHCTRDAITPFE